jgi:hypothetical protein
LDLELAAEVLAVGVILESAPTIKHAPLGTLCDNTPTVSWVEKMASKSNTPTTGCLLRGLAFKFHCHHAGRLVTVHVPGMDNVMADIASRPTKAQKLFHSPTTLSDSAFCSAFDIAFPLPDDQQWTLVTSPHWMKFNVFETLRGKRLALSLWTGAEHGTYWKAWTEHCALYGAASDPGTTVPDTDKLPTFAVAVWEGPSGRGAHVKVQSIKKILRQVPQKLVLDGHPDPRKASPAQQALDLPISRLLKSFGNRDLPAQPKLAIPISTITAISEKY